MNRAKNILHIVEQAFALGAVLAAEMVARLK